MLSSLLLPLFLVLPALQAAPAQAPAVAPEATSPLARISVLGASLSDGMGLQEKEEVGARTTLADVIEAALLAEHEPVVSTANLFMFMNTAAQARQQIAAAQDRKATLFVGLDFLFWYGYGTHGSEAGRLAMLEKGLAELEPFECPVVVGDFPDMSQALQGKSKHMGGGPIIAKEQIPSPETLKRLNERLAEWAKERPNVVVVPLGELVRKIQANEEITLRGNKWPAGSMSTLMQPDLLHTTLRGSVAVWLFAADHLVRARPEIPAASFEWDAESIRKKVYAAKEKDRLAQAERDRKRKLKETPPPEPVHDPSPTKRERTEEQEEEAGEEPQRRVPVLD